MAKLGAVRCIGLQPNRKCLRVWKATIPIRKLSATKLEDTGPGKRAMSAVQPASGQVGASHFVFWVKHTSRPQAAKHHGLEGEQLVESVLRAKARTQPSASRMHVEDAVPAHANAISTSNCHALQHVIEAPASFALGIFQTAAHSHQSLTTCAAHAPV